MIRFTTLLVCSILAVVNVSGQLQDILPAPGTYFTEHDTSPIYNTARQNEIWAEDFASGIPEDWSNEEINGIASWEYRGPDTSPDIYIGSRGSCIPEGAAGSDPIDSESWANGFIVFDSNYWDDNIGPCNDGFGSGPSPAPHQAWLTTPSIDLSEETEVMLMFTHFFKEWTNNADAFVEYSADGGEWTQIFTPEIEVGNSTSADALEVINMTEYAAGATDFKLRFTFDGSYYYWMIDDIIIFEPATNDMVIQSSGFGNYDVFDESLETGFEGLEYSMYPDEMPPYLEFYANVINAGAETQTGVQLNVEIVNDNTSEVVYEMSSGAANIGTQAQSTLIVEAFQMPAIGGEYTINMTLTQDQEDEDGDTNFASHHFNINDVMFARDHRETTGIYIPGSIFTNTPYEIGNMFVVSEEGMEAHSVSVGVGLGSVPGSEIYAAIYKLNLLDLGSTELLAMSPTSEVYWEAFNNFGEDKTMVIEFDSPITLEKDSAYLVVAGTPESGAEIKIATSGETPAYSSWVRFMPQQWFYMIQHPMVRLNFGEVVGVEENLDHQAVVYQNFPNPFDKSTQINFKLEQNADVWLEVRDYLGRKTKEVNLGNKPSGSHSFLFEKGDLSPGMYTYTLLLGKYSVTKAMVIKQ